jgi:hypothetical protein
MLCCFWPYAETLFCFVLKRGQKLCPNRLIKEFYKRCYKLPTFTHPTPKPTLPTTNDSTLLLPQWPISELHIWSYLACYKKKNSRFLSFQVSQMARRERSDAFRCGDASSAIKDHQPFRGRLAHCLGWIPWMPSHSFRSSHIRVVKRHSTKRWLTVSKICLQRGQSP